MTLFAAADDVDQDMLTYSWIDSGGTPIPRVPNPCFTPSTLGVHTFTVTADDGHGHTASSSVTVDFGGGSTRETLVVTAPQPGEIVSAGVPYTIRWTSSGNGDGETMLFYITTDNGATSTHIWECDYTTVGAHECTWNNPSPTTETAQISMFTRDADVPASGGSGVFAIHPRGTLPRGWSDLDIGAVGASGSATSSDESTVTVTGSGADIWGTADQFHYAWTSMSGDFEVDALVSSVQNVNAWTKAGVMIRETTSIGSRHASLFATPGKGLAFQRRTAQNGTSVSTPGPLLKAPVWVRLTRRGPLLSAYYRKAITDLWTRIGDQTLSGLATNLMVGLAVTSHVSSTLATATFSEVRVAPLIDWAGTPVGNIGAQFNHDGTVFNVIGRGNDFWGTADQGYYVWAPLDGDGTITARVRSIQNTNAWAKAGVMIRESLAADSKQVFMLVSPGKGVTMQYRYETGGLTISAAKSNWESGPIPGAAPGWVRLTRRNYVFFGEWSTDGVNWTPVGDTGQIFMPSKIYIGLAVTSHNATVNATGVFDDVIVRQ